MVRIENFRDDEGKPRTEFYFGAEALPPVLVAIDGTGRRTISAYLSGFDLQDTSSASIRALGHALIDAADMFDRIHPEKFHSPGRPSHER
jgi:hypothetical protein